MKKILIIIIALVALMGGIATALVMFELIPRDMLPPILLANLAEPAKPAPPPPSPSAYVDMDQIAVPILLDKQVKGSILIEIRLEVDSLERSKVEEKGPILHDAIIRDLYDFLPKHLADRPTVDLSALKSRLHAVANRVVGSGKVRAVLVQNVYNR